MQNTVLILLLVSLVIGVVGVLVSSKKWQRGACLLLVLFIMGMYFDSAFNAAKMGSALVFHDQYVQPTERLLEIIRKDLVEKKHDQALTHVELAIQKWPMIKPWTKSYTVQDLVNELGVMGNHGPEHSF